MKEQKLDYHLFLILTSVVSLLAIAATIEVFYASALNPQSSFASRVPQSVASGAGLLVTNVDKKLYKIVRFRCDMLSKSKGFGQKTQYISFEGNLCVKGSVKNLSIKNITNKLDGVGLVLENQRIKTDYMYLSQGINEIEIKFLNQGKEYVYNMSIHRKKM